MAKKITAIIICAIILVMTVPFTASAANSASFRVRLAEQTDKTATVVVEFVDGMGFGALDFEVKFDNLKLKLTEAKLGSGYKSFRDEAEENGQQVIGSINANSNPIKVSVATLQPFEKKNDDGILLRMAFSKINKTKVTENDVQLSVTNCQTTGLKDIAVSVSYSMNAETAENNARQNSTAYAQRTSQDNIDEENGEPATSGENSGASSDAETKSAPDSEIADPKSENLPDVTSTAPGKTTGKEQTPSSAGMTNKSKTVIVITAAVVLAIGIAVLVLVLVRNKKKQETDFFSSDD